MFQKFAMTYTLLYEIRLNSDHRSGSAEGGQPSAGVWGVPKESLFKRI